MSWAQTSEGKGFPVYTETLTTRSVATNRATNWSSQIDFIPPGTDFTIIANAAKTTLSLSTHLELFVSYTKDAAPHTVAGLALRTRRKVTPFIAITGALQTTV